MTDQIEVIRQWLGSGSINFFGLPFAGKDSQANRLQKRFGGSVLGGGDILRNSVIPSEIEAIMHTGELIPTQDYINIVLPYLSKSEFTGQPLFLSSVGRWKGEEQGVIEVLNDSHHPLKAVIYLPLDEAIVFKRLHLKENATTRGARADDDEEKLKKRVEEFRNKTLPVIEFYRNQGLLIEVDATLSKDEVEQRILTALAEKASHASASP